MAQIEERQLSADEFVVTVRNLPEFRQLKEKVDDLVKRCSWLEQYGWDTGHMLVGWLLHMLALALLSRHQTAEFILGVLLLGLGHSILTAKVLHQASHGGMGRSELYNRLLCWLCGDVVGAFPSTAGTEIHVRVHHPHTNIIGLGDSSTWRAPRLPALIYLFAAPALLPALTPIVGVSLLLGRPLQLLLFVASAAGGLAANLLLLDKCCGLALWPALATLLLARAAFSFSYIHINVFQHIGLPMWSPKHRPRRLYQMSAGVLNLCRSPLLDAAFGHSLISCHVEHHLFPRLSDSLCLRVKPIVREFLLRHGLPYNEDSYTGRLRLFASDYRRLMVHAPPVWRYVGVQ